MNSLETDIETLFETQASDFDFSKRFRQEIEHYLGSLPAIFEENQGKDFLVRHTRALDEYIALMYKTVLRRMFGNYLPMRNHIPIALVALGSYGREQLCVYSDIDLMIVYEPQDGYNIEAIIQKFLYLAWDAGLKLGHRVHKISDLFKASEDDITIKTAMIEARFIVGSSFTRHAMEHKLNTIRCHAPERFIRAKLDEAAARAKKHPISMQPNIKEGVGGLRDSQLLFWIAKTRLGIHSLKELSGTLYTEETYRRYRMALELLYRVRSALHLAVGKQHDQLHLEHLPTLRRMLGFKTDMKLAAQLVEAMWQVHNFSSIFVTKLSRYTRYDADNIAPLRRSRIQKGIFHVNNCLCASFRLPAQPIDTLLDVLISLPDVPQNFDNSFLSQMTYTTIKHPLSQSLKMKLRRIFERKHMHAILQLFYDAGVLSSLFPAFKKSVYLPQFDGYHHYPVGQHSIECVKAYETITDPAVQHFYETLSAHDQSLLKILVFMHDAGKGRILDHSEVGVKLIRSLLAGIQYSDDDIADATLLIRHHILMSNVAQRHNFHNEKTLYKFMSVVKTPRLLTMLYILTYADITGVGPGTYNAFNAKLLLELYHASLEVAQEEARITDAARRLKIEQRLARLKSYQRLPRLLQKKITSIESNLFFFRHTPDDLVEIARRASTFKNYTFDLRFDTGLSLEIMRRVPFNLSYLLGKLGYLDVVSMEVFTLFDDVRYFRIDFLQIPTVDMYETIREIVDDAFNMDNHVPISSPVITENDVMLDCDHSRDYAELAVHTANQRGLLAYIVHTFDVMGIQIATAKIHTTKKKARDYFLIEKQPIFCNNTNLLITKLVQEEQEACAVL